jgi:hypothetical protein
LYDFDSKYFFGLLRYEFVASGESTLPEKVAFEVSGDLIIVEIMIFDDFEILMCLIMKIEYDRAAVGSLKWINFV